MIPDRTSLSSSATSAMGRGVLLGALGALLVLSGCNAESREGAGAAEASAQPGEATAAAQDSSGEASGEQPGAAAARAGAGEEDVYGSGVQQTEPVPIAAILDDPEAYAGKTVRVEGTVTDVCPKRGCWFEMAGDEPGQKMRFKVQDGVMVFPMSAKGKHAVAEGVVALQPLSMEQTRQYLEYQAREYGLDVDPDSVTEPMTIVRLDGTGARIRDPR